MKKQRSINNKLLPMIPILAILLLWQSVSSLGLVPAFMLPSPIQVAKAFVSDFSSLMTNAIITIGEALLGLFFALLAGLFLAILMDHSPLLEKAIAPLLLLTQTVPTVALAPLLVLWMGYGIAPKIMLVFLTCFFPVAIGLLGGLRQADPDAIILLQSMGATQWQIYKHIKLPGALPEFFSGLRISATYALVGAVVAEWLGGDSGLGVYMTRVRKNYSFDKMFAVIFFISLLSILLIQLVKWIEKKATPWTVLKERKTT